MTTALELFDRTREQPESWQRELNQFVDDFRRASADARAAMVAEPIHERHRMAGLVAAVISALSRELDMQVPEWVGHTGSPEPFFVLPARSFELRLRLMIESPPPFRVRNVFVPENYLSRA